MSWYTPEYPEKTEAPAATEASEIKHQVHDEPSISTAEKTGKPPAELVDLPAWLVWKFEPDAAGKKPRKVPYYAKGGRRHGKMGGPADRAALVTYAEAVRAAGKGFEGVGFAPLPEFGIVALDFDRCVVAGDVLPEVERLVSCTYAELSPSGHGVRAFMRGTLGDDKAHGDPYGFEVFSNKGFVTFTGNRLDVTELLGTGDTIADVTDDVRALAASRFGTTATDTTGADPLMTHEPRLGLTDAQIGDCLAVLDADMGHDDWLKVGMALHHETEGQGFEVWDTWSAAGDKYPGADTLLRRWESFGTMSGRPVTARSLVKMANDNGAGLVLDQGSAEDFAAIADDTATAPKAPRFEVVPAGDFSRGQRPGWIIKGVLPRAELVVLFGESGSGKSFLALDLGAAIARGVDWRGHRTKAGRVVYIAAEGAGGFRGRLTAYANHNQVQLDDLQMGVIHAAPNFLQKADALDVAKAIGRADVVIVDTFAQVIPGANENAADDIGRALAHCRGIHRATGAVVVLVHHAGKDPTKGARGWSGLRAAADAELEVLRLVNGRKVRVSKQKDGDDGLEWGFDLVQVPIGTDEDGDVIDSCVVVETAVPVTQRVGSRRPAGKWEQLVIEVVGEIAIGQSSGIEVEHVVAEALRRAPPQEEGKRDTRKQRIERALKALCEGDDAPYFCEGDCLEVL